MFVDMHCHAYRRPPPVYPFQTPEQVLCRYDALGIEKGALLPVVSPEIYLPQANEDILDMVTEHPDRFFAFCNIDPRAMTNSARAPLGDLLRHYRDRGCRGLGEVMPNLPLMHPMVQNLLYHAESVGLPVVFDGSDQTEGDFGLYDDPGLPQLEHTLQRFPDLILFGHGPVFWSEIGRLETPGERASVFRLQGGQVGCRPSGPIREEGVVPKLLRRYPNLYGDLSDRNPYLALTRDPEYGPRFLTEFQDRLLFGTDLCSPQMPVPLVDLLLEWRDTGKITPDVFHKVARGNAIRVFGLG
ncbi:MAG: amidohydrolase family protein [Lentisphaeria bacterium]|nr:amidohydrolase family protein [Lentisphaeria bacterium]